jgi:hypothetical protein
MPEATIGTPIGHINVNHTAYMPKLSLLPGTCTPKLSLYRTQPGTVGPSPRLSRRISSATETDIIFAILCIMRVAGHHSKEVGVVARPGQATGAVDGVVVVES